MREEAIQDVFDGATIMVGGFGLCGMPENLIRALAHKGVKNLTTISNNVGVDGVGMGLLLANGQIRKHIGTYVGENKLLEQMVLNGTCNSTWFRKERLPSEFGPGALAFPPSLPPPASERWSPKAKKHASSTAALTSWSAR
jgi:3-oxoacid CoA-transferase subunit A